jgi:Tetracyclin repressor-like, C-terminal domain
VETYRVTITLGTRTRQVGDAAIAVLAEHGARGLTHRAVDQAAGLPPGTTSNYARTRSALLGLTLARIAELDAGGASGLAGSGSYESEQSESGLSSPELSESGLSGPGLSGFGLADALARMLHRTITDDGARQRVLARFELAFKATRQPELRAAYDDLGRRFHEEAARLLAAAGSAEPDRDAWTLIAFIEGTAFYALAGAGAAAPPPLPALRAQIAALLAGTCADDLGAA